MRQVPLQKIVEDGIRFLSEIFPLKTYLYFPLLNASAIWAAKRLDEWREQIFSWKVWLEPDTLLTKPDEFILNFFQNTPCLGKAFQAEIQSKDMKALRRAFVCLFPVVGLEDPFLTALFHQELESGDFRKIVEEFSARASQARHDIKAAEPDPRFFKGLKAFRDEVCSLGADLILQAEIQKMVAASLKRLMRKKDE